MGEHAGIIVELTNTEIPGVGLIPLLPLLAFLIITLITLRWGRLSAAVSILAMLASLGLSAQLFLTRNSQADVVKQADFPWIDLGWTSVKMGLLVDNLSSLMLLMVCFIALLIQIYSFSYMETEIHHFPTQGSATLSRFYAYMSLFAFSMLGLVLSTNLLQIYVFWELVGACSFLLVGFWFFKTSATAAAKKAFVVTRFADLFFLMGILMMGTKLGTFGFVELNSMVAGNSEVWQYGYLAIAATLIFCGAIGKSAQFPLQVWLPDAMEGPTPVSALIHAATMVAAGVYLVARLFPVFDTAILAGHTVAYIGAVTALMAATMACVQNDIKKVLAYSTISQLGYMMAALGSGAYTAGTFHLITHAFFKALLFLGSGAVIVACHSQDMWTMGGLRKKLPMTSLAFACGCLALAGIFPFAGFWSKDEILAGTHGPVLVMLVLAAFLTAFYVGRMFFITFLGEYRGESELAGPIPPANLTPPVDPSWEVFTFKPDWTEERAVTAGTGLPPACLGAHMEQHPHGHHEPKEVSPIMYGPLLILALFATFLGFVGMPWDNNFEHFIHSPFQSEHPFHAAMMAFSLLVALSGLFVAWTFYGKDPAAGERRLQKRLGFAWTVFQQKYYMDHLWAWLLSGSLYLGARIASWVDDNIVDGVVNFCGQVTVWAGNELRKEQSGRVQQYLLLIILAVLVLIFGLGLAEPTFLVNPVMQGGPHAP